MATYTVTTSNWNSPAFWSSINESASGHTLDFRPLPANFSVVFDANSDRITISNGTTSFVVGEPGASGTNANLGGTTDWSFFTTVFGTQGNDTLTGGSGNDTILGTDGDDVIDGGGGDDLLRPGPGSDTLLGGAGNDTLELSDNDSMDGGDGIDVLDATFGNFAETVTFSADNSGNTGANNTTFENIEVFNSGDGADLYDASAATGDMTISTGADNDTILGGSGNESLDGGAGDDSIEGGAGNDTLTGGAGNDTLDGGAGNDTLDGGAGTDTLTGGSGADVFVADGTADRITDFDTTTGINGGASTDNDFVDLSASYNQTNLDAWNLANPGQTYANPLEWLRADQADNNVLDQAGGLVIENGGSSVAASELNAENTGVVCFTQGTLIKTKRGEIPVEDLRVGDRVQTMDNGFQTVRWIGRRVVREDTLVQRPNLRPVRVNKDFLGINGLDTDLVVSPQHRLLLVSKIADRMFGTKEVLIPAKKLLSLPGAAAIEAVTEVCYFHILFEEHEIVFANSVPAESLYLGAEALKSLSAAGRAEIEMLFPETAQPDFSAGQCRPFAEGKRANHLAVRLAKNNKKLFDPVAL